MLHYIKKSYISGQSAKLYLYSAHEKPVKYAKEVEAILKRISVKFQQQEQTYRSLHAAARSLLSSKGRVFLLFLLFYKVLTNFLFVPALQLIWALTLRFAPIRYLNNKTASRIFASPAIIGCIAVLAVLAAFWSLYEVAAMLQLLTRVRHGEPLRVGAVFRDAFCSLVRVFLPQNLPLLLYGAALIPLTNFFSGSKPSDPVCRAGISLGAAEGARCQPFSICSGSALCAGAAAGRACSAAKVPAGT